MALLLALLELYKGGLCSGQERKDSGKGFQVDDSWKYKMMSGMIHVSSVRRSLQHYILTAIVIRRVRECFLSPVIREWCGAGRQKSFLVIKQRQFHSQSNNY